MKKTLLTLSSVLFFSIILFAQSNDSQHETNTGGDGLHLDITSLIIGVVVGAAIGYFAGSKKS